MKLQSGMFTGNGCLSQHVNLQGIGSDQPCVCIQLLPLRFSQLIKERFAIVCIFLLCSGITLIEIAVYCMYHVQCSDVRV